jgi:hypothetical protein
VIAADANTVIAHLESVPTAVLRVYGLRDNNGRGMDCLKVFQPGGDDHGSVFGVYHYRKGGVFSVHLARSANLVDWTHITPLDKHASQATIWQCDNGAYLLAYEKDAPNGCWIRLRFYKDRARLLKGEHERQFDIPRTLAPTAEGTPSFEHVNLKNNKLDESEIRIRFHYYKDMERDQLAHGTLTDFRSWKSAASDRINAELARRKWLGNLGDRDRFTWGGQVFYLQEVQHKPGDWTSWRVFLCDGEGMPVRKLSIRTRSGSTAFANPNATWITDSKGRRVLVVTMFLPSEGNAPTEAGSLLYAIDPSTKKGVPNRER